MDSQNRVRSHKVVVDFAIELVMRDIRLRNLSLGEQQRIAFARVLLAKPRFVILDEATSALDSKNEEMLYQKLVDSGATLISVSHRLNILKYHIHVLELEGDGSWQISLARDMEITSGPISRSQPEG